MVTGRNEDRRVVELVPRTVSENAVDTQIVQTGISDGARAQRKAEESGFSPAQIAQLDIATTDPENTYQKPYEPTD